uniref:Uncharacterized protein n=1 Tax=Ixodes ricinus TaxID=34613 RepID=A0A6B0U6A2_IXORI
MKICLLVLGLSSKGWQSRTLKPWPWHRRPFTRKPRTNTGSWPVLRAWKPRRTEKWGGPSRSTFLAPSQSLSWASEMSKLSWESPPGDLLPSRSWP